MATDQTQPNPLYLAAAVVISTLFVINAVLAIQAWFYNQQERVFERHVIQQPFTEYNDLSARQRALLNSYTIDAELERYSIPIDEAMAIVVREAKIQEAATP